MKPYFVILSGVHAMRSLKDLLRSDYWILAGLAPVAGIRPLINGYSREYIRLLQQLP